MENRCKRGVLHSQNEYTSTRGIMTDLNQSLTQSLTPESLLTLNPAYAAVTGAAGSGKTYLIRRCMELDPAWGLLCATTAAAAKVLGSTVPTLHSAAGIHGDYIKQTALIENLVVLRKKYAHISRRLRRRRRGDGISRIFRLPPQHAKSRDPTRSDFGARATLCYRYENYK